MCLHAITRERIKDQHKHHYNKSEASHLLLLFVEPFCRNNNIDYKYMGLVNKEASNMAIMLNDSMQAHKPVILFECYRDLMLFLESFHHAFEACNDACKHTVRGEMDKPAFEDDRMYGTRTLQ